MASRKQSAKETPEFKCSYCKKSYVQEARFLLHMCPKKQRWLDRDRKDVIMGFMAYRRFHEISMHASKPKEHADFIDSKLYVPFVKFGRYLLDIIAINPQQFVEFLIKTGLPLDQWHNPVVYERYVRELNKKETADAAVERNFLLMEQWGRETGECWTDFFRKITPAQATQFIRSGRISPWVLYTAPSAWELLDRFSPEQVKLVEQYIDPEFWDRKLARHPDDVKQIKAILKKAGV